MRLLVTRPAPDGAATVARLRALDHDTQWLPLLATEPLAWTAPAARPSAVMLTSAAAARLAGPAAAQFHDLPCFAVGAATAAAARAAGFADVRDGGGTVQALVDRLVADGCDRVLHLAGADRTPVALPAGLRIEVVTVYAARLLALAALPVADWVLLYSARTARHFAAEIDRRGGERAAYRIAALSAAVAAAAGAGWRAVITAATPDEPALLAAIAATCQREPR